MDNAKRLNGNTAGLSDRSSILGIGQYQSKLLTAITRDQIGRSPHHLFQYLRNLFQTLITSQMTISIIKCLKVINIHHHH